MIEIGAILIPLGIIGLCTIGILVGGSILIDKIHNRFFKEKI